MTIIFIFDIYVDVEQVTIEYVMHHCDIRLYRFIVVVTVNGINININAI